MEGLKQVLEEVREEVEKFDFELIIGKLRPIHRAVLDKDLVTLEELLRRGGDPDQEDKTIYGFTAAHWAAVAGNSQVLDLLDKFDSNMSMVDGNDLTPLHAAALSGNSDTLLWLIENTHDIESRDEDEQTPLHQAALNGRLEAAKILVENGASIEAVDAFGMTPICLAMVRGFTAVVSFLLDRGANPAVRDESNKTLLHAAAANDDILGISLVLEKGLSVNANDDMKSTPLHDAAWNGSSLAVGFLLKNGAQLEAKDINGRTPLFIAKEAGHAECVRLLTPSGSDQAYPINETQPNLTHIQNGDCFMEKGHLKSDSCSFHVDSQNKDPCGHRNVNSNEDIQGKNSGFDVEGEESMSRSRSVVADGTDEEGTAAEPGGGAAPDQEGPHEEVDNYLDVPHHTNSAAVSSTQIGPSVALSEVFINGESYFVENISNHAETNVSHNERGRLPIENVFCTKIEDLTFNELKNIIF